MTKACIIVGLAIVAANAMGNDRVRTALDAVMAENFNPDGDAELIAEECGLPQSLYVSPSFTNLVAVVQTEINDCSLPFLCELTNSVPRDVFIEAAIRCGQSAYRNAVTNWFGGSVGPAVSPELMEDYIAAPRTSMEGYFINHYNEPGISNMWLRLRSMYLAVGNTNEVTGIDHILNGKSKVMRELLDSLE